MQLASPTEASLGASATSLTNSEDPAATVGITDRITLSAVLKFDDGSTKSMTSDARTVFTVTAGSDLVILVGNKLYAVAGTSGSATVTLSFANYSGAAALTASRTVTVGSGGYCSTRQGWHLTQHTRIRSALDDPASTMCLPLRDGDQSLWRSDRVSAFALLQRQWHQGHGAAPPYSVQWGVPAGSIGGRSLHELLAVSSQACC